MLSVNSLFQSRMTMITALREKSTHDTLRSSCLRREGRTLRAFLKHLRLLSRRLTAKCSDLEAVLVRFDALAAKGELERPMWRAQFYGARRLVWQLHRARILSDSIAPVGEARLARRLFDLHEQRLTASLSRLARLRSSARRRLVVPVPAPEPTVQTAPDSVSLLRRVAAWLSHPHAEIGVGG
jgi:hypothetical protein